MRNRKIVVLLILICVLIVSFTSCGNTLKKDDPAVGTWEMTQLEYNGQVTNIDEMISTGALSETATLTISANGEFEFKFRNSSGKGNVIVKDGSYQISDTSDNIMTFKIKNEKLTLEYEKQGIAMIFEKSK